MGVNVTGLFLGFDVYTGVNSGEHVTARAFVDVACGRDAYRIYLRDNYDADIVGALAVGEKVTIKCRPYVSKANRLAWTDGEIVL